MRTYSIILGTASAVALGLAGCRSETDVVNEANSSDVEVLNEADASASGAAGGTAASGTTWPEGSRIVVENGVTYRVDPGGLRVALGPADSRVVVEGDSRFRVDPDGTRVRIDEDGAVIDLDADGVDANVDLDGDTSVQVNTN